MPMKRPRRFGGASGRESSFPILDRKADFVTLCAKSSLPDRRLLRAERIELSHPFFSKLLCIPFFINTILLALLDFFV